MRKGQILYYTSWPHLKVFSYLLYVLNSSLPVSNLSLCTCYLSCSISLFWFYKLTRISWLPHPCYNLCPSYHIIYDSFHQPVYTSFSHCIYPVITSSLSSTLFTTPYYCVLLLPYFPSVLYQHRNHLKHLGVGKGQHVHFSFIYEKCILQIVQLSLFLLILINPFPYPF